ncbi:MAG: hypothetical protein EOO32_00725 [Comamonadaceae bacterium]|nr:MAG: hypothetical protein EOO32_00725 [Comamonadaceae bacterium]
MSTKETIELVDEFIKGTQHGTLVWSTDSAPYNLIGPDVRVGVIYHSSYLNQNIRLYRKEYKNYYDESSYSWDMSLELEIVDFHGNTLYTFPTTSNLRNLFNAVTYQTSGVANLFKSLKP